MFKVLIIAALIGCAVANYDSPITKFNNQINQDDTYAFEYAQQDGTSVQEAGNAGHNAQGAYSYTSPEGVPVNLVYTADEYGFHPSSDVLPVAPPIPDYILRSIQYIQQHPTPEELADREVRKTQF